ncbi:hypothetical protein FRC07_003501 [Ceratobasidium sp. 392]|nr:hypothetical protein FRC07_003501 [Ceratobasidium sp. 392]
MINNQVERDAQMKVVARTFNLPLVGKPRIQRRVVHGVEMSSQETMHNEFDKVVLGTPVRKLRVVSTQLKNQLLGYFHLVSPLATPAELKRRVDFNSVISYSRFRMVPDGDRIRTAALIQNNPITRNNSFVKYDLLPDHNARYWNRRDRPYRRTYYGQCVGVYFVQFINDDGVLTAYLLAAIKACNTDGSDAVQPETPVVTYTELEPINMVHINTIIAVVGRIKLGEMWAIVDRSRENTRPTFNDDDDNDEGEDGRD